MDSQQTSQVDFLCDPIGRSMCFASRPDMPPDGPMLTVPRGTSADPSHADHCIELTLTAKAIPTTAAAVTEPTHTH